MIFIFAPRRIVAFRSAKGHAKHEGFLQAFLFAER